MTLILGTENSLTIVIVGGNVEVLVVAEGSIVASVPHRGITPGGQVVVTDLTETRTTLHSLAVVVVATAAGVHLGLVTGRREAREVVYPPAGLRGVMTRLMLTVHHSPIQALGVRLFLMLLADIVYLKYAYKLNIFFTKNSFLLSWTYDYPVDE